MVRPELLRELRLLRWQVAAGLLLLNERARENRRKRVERRRSLSSDEIWLYSSCF